MSTPASLRKAAVLIASLDPPLADGLLRQMEPEQAERLRSAVAQLTDLDPREQRQVLDEFFRSGGKPAPAARPLVEVAPELQSKLDRPAARREIESERPRAPQRATEDSSPLRFLQQVDAADLAECLRGEQPQMIALVVAQLSAERTAAAIAELPGDVQPEVLRRLVDLDDAHPDVLHDVARELQARLARITRGQSKRRSGLASLNEILNAADERCRSRIMGNLSRHDRQLAGLLARPNVSRLESLDDLDDRSLVRVLQEADPQVAVLALAGSTPLLIERALGQFPPGAARALRTALQHMGPTPLSDLEQARDDLLDLARRMQSTGRLRQAQEPQLNAAA